MNDRFLYFLNCSCKYLSSHREDILIIARKANVQNTEIKRPTLQLDPYFSLKQDDKMLHIFSLVATLYLGPRTGLAFTNETVVMGNPTFCCAGLFITWWGYLAMNSASTMGVEGTRLYKDIKGSSKINMLEMIIILQIKLYILDCRGLQNDSNDDLYSFLSLILT